MNLSRRAALIGASVTVAAAAMPKAASALVEPVKNSTPAWSMEFPDWSPGEIYSVGATVRRAGRVHYVMVAHVSSEQDLDRLVELNDEAIQRFKSLTAVSNLL